MPHRDNEVNGREKGRAVCLVDGHVHFYPLFDAWTGLEAAGDNFSEAKRRLALPEDTVGVLMFARSSGEGSLRDLHARLSRTMPRGWTLGFAAEKGWLHATRASDGLAVYIVGGQQVRASNGLEVLALGPATRFGDGRPFSATLAEVREGGSIAVIPWGFGKWLGARGREVAEAALEGDASGGTLFLGDNASRPSLLPDPKLFRAARERGVFVLPGSDPMPVPGEERSMGRFGFVLDGFDLEGPWRSIRRGLVALDRQPAVFGGRLSLPRSLGVQMRLRLRRAGRVGGP